MVSSGRPEDAATDGEKRVRRFEVPGWPETDWERGCRERLGLLPGRVACVGSLDLGW